MNRSPGADGLVGGDAEDDHVDVGERVADDVVEPPAQQALGLVQPGGVDQHELAARPVHDAADGVPGGLRAVADDADLLADQRVGQRGLAGVGAAHQAAKPLRYGAGSGVVTRSSLPPGSDADPSRRAGRIGAWHGSAVLTGARPTGSGDRAPCRRSPRLRVPRRPRPEAHGHRRRPPRCATGSTTRRGRCRSSWCVGGRRRLAGRLRAGAAAGPPCVDEAPLALGVGAAGAGAATSAGSPCRSTALSADIPADPHRAGRRSSRSSSSARCAPATHRPDWPPRRPPRRLAARAARASPSGTWPTTAPPTGLHPLGARPGGVRRRPRAPAGDDRRAASLLSCPGTRWRSTSPASTTPRRRRCGRSTPPSAPPRPELDMAIKYRMPTYTLDGRWRPGWPRSASRRTPSTCASCGACCSTTRSASSGRARPR